MNKNESHINSQSGELMCDDSLKEDTETFLVSSSFIELYLNCLHNSSSSTSMFFVSSHDFAEAPEANG